MIEFWKTRDPFGELSNFFYTKIVIENKEYKSVEHYYQSKKFEGTEWEDYICNQPTAKLAADEARRQDLPLREDWDDIKEDIMYVGLQAKFKNERFKNVLLSTKNETIVENSPSDRYWGQHNGVGKNRLGKLLMKLRDEIRNKETFF